MFALAVETRQYTRHILYRVLCQLNFSKFIPYRGLHFSECEMGIICKKAIQAHNRTTWKCCIRVLECTLSPVLYIITSCNVTHVRACLVFRGTYVCFTNDVASPYRPHILSIFTCWHEAGEHGEGEIRSQLYRKPVLKAGPLPRLPTPEQAHCVAQGCQILAGCRKGGSLGIRQAFHSWMQRWTSCPVLYRSFLSCRLLWRRRVGRAAHRLLQRSPDPPSPGSGVPAIGSCHLPPSGDESWQLHYPAWC